MLTLSGGDRVRIFTISGIITLADLTIAHGRTPARTESDALGGGVLNQGTVYVSHCVFTHNFAIRGGGGLCNAGSATLIGCLFDSNSADSTHSNFFFSFGGGFCNGGSYGYSIATLTRCTFMHNSALSGGGLYNDGHSYGQANVNNCVFDSNFATGGGGGLCNDGGASQDTITLLQLSNCVLTHNSAGNAGGGFLNVGAGTGSGDGYATAILSNCTLAYNSALNGGGFYSSGSEGTAIATLNNCTLAHNSAASTGGGFYNDGQYTSGNFGEQGARATLSNCTFAYNSAVGNGGGLFNDGISGNAQTTLNNATFAANTAARGGSLYNDGSQGHALLGIGNSILDNAQGSNFLNKTGTITSLGYNLSNDAANGDATQGPGGYLNAPGDIRNTDPQLDPTGLQDNGGPTQTIALQPTSPAINAGNSVLLTDQRERVRPYLYLGVPLSNTGNGSDIGAFELGSTITPQLGPTFTVTTTSDHAGACAADDCTLRSAIIAVTRLNGSAINFASGVQGVITLSSALSPLNNLTIQGPGADVLTVSGADKTRIFTTKGRVTLSGLTIAHGRATGSRTLDSAGGGILNDVGFLVVSHCNFVNNFAAGNGGGLDNNGIATDAFDPADVIAKDCNFTHNIAAHGNGGGIANDGSQGYAGLQMSNCVFSHNTALQGSGGGICNNALHGMASIIMNYCNFAQNSAQTGGGFSNYGPHEGYANTTLNECAFGQNSARIGGGFYNYSARGADFINCTLAQNTATLGGGLYNGNQNSAKTTVQLRYCTLAQNTAATGGGCYDDGVKGLATLVLSNSILSNATGGNLTTNHGVVISQGYNLSSDAVSGDMGHGPSGLLNSPGDIRNTDPLLDPNGLRDNGGPTQTVALQTGSPAINAGNPKYKSPPDPRTDQRGPGFARVFGGRLDIGAFEVQAPVTSGQLSSATASVATNSITLRFNTALAADAASDATHYSVTVNGRAVPIASAAYNARNLGVALDLAPGTLRRGDKVTVRWTGLADAAGRAVSGSVTSLIAN